MKSDGRVWEEEGWASTNRGFIFRDGEASLLDHSVGIRGFCVKCAEVL
jgi:hypothetical protein